MRWKTLVMAAIFAQLSLLGGVHPSPAEISTHSSQRLDQLRAKQRTRAELNRLLQQRNQHPERSAEIDQLIRKIFAETQAVLVLDMSGFSRMTASAGIIPTLALIQRQNSIAIPLVEANGGKVIRLEADNIFAVFPKVDSAVIASFNILKRLQVANVYASTGIGYGELLIIEGEDLYGSEMNFASKLGEDVAKRGELLLTQAAYAQLNTEPNNWEKSQLTISGLQLVFYKAKQIHP